MAKYTAGWGATRDEARRPLPGDGLVAEPASQVTRAVTIRAPRQEVWRWLVQMGADRGGFYSYDRLENVFRLGIHNADRVVPEWQHREVGDLVYADSKGRGGWYVVEVHPEEALVLQTANLSEGRPLRRDEGLGWEFLWSFVLEDAPGGGTRLLVRERVAFGRRSARAVLTPVGLVSFAMTRKMMLELKERSESATPAI